MSARPAGKLRVLGWRPVLYIGAVLASLAALGAAVGDDGPKVESRQAFAWRLPAVASRRGR